jgi:hypothetical protein
VAGADARIVPACHRDTVIVTAPQKQRPVIAAVEGPGAEVPAAVDPSVGGCIRGS